MRRRYFLPSQVKKQYENLMQASALRVRSWPNQANAMYGLVHEDGGLGLTTTLLKMEA